MVSFQLTCFDLGQLMIFREFSLVSFLTKLAVCLVPEEEEESFMWVA